MKMDIKTLGENARSYFDANFDKKMLMDMMDQYFYKEIENT